MKTAIVRFVLIVAGAAALQAQPVVGPEVVWRTTSPARTYRPAPQAARLAADGSGFVVGWSEVLNGTSRACAGTLTGSGGFASFGVCTVGAADAPSLAPLGDRYIAAWLEPGNDTRPLLVTAALDRNFTLLSARLVDLTLGPPIVRVTGSRVFAGSGLFVYELDRDGAIANVFVPGPPVDDVAVGGGEVAYTSHTLTHTPPFCGFFRCSTPFDTYALTVTWLSKITLRESWRFNSDAPSGIAATGHEILVVYFDAAEGRARAILWGDSPRAFGLPGKIPSLLDAQAQPQIAWDGGRWLVVWGTGEGIEGVGVTSDLAVTPIAIAAHGARPAVASATKGRFVVTYEVIEGAARRLVSRTVDFEPPPPGRGRAIR